MQHKLVISSALIAIILIALGAVLKWSILADVVHNKIIQFSELKNGTTQWDRFERLPIPINFKVYLFEITNPIGAMLGKKIIIREKGPYVYRESREKIEIVVENDTIQYFENQYYRFDTHASVGSEDDEIIILNPALNGAMQIVEDQYNRFLKPFSDGIPYIFGSDSLFLKGKVGDILFNGIKVCDPAVINTITKTVLKIRVNLICNILRTKAKELRNMRPDPFDPKTILFSLLHHKYSTNDGHYMIRSGKDNIQTVGNIEEWQNSKETKFWLPNTTCSKVRGRDSIIYPPFVTKDDVLEVFNTDICRTVELYYEKDLDYRGVSLNRFSLAKNTMNAPEENGDQCYCINKSKGIRRNNSECFYSGILDLYTCYGAPTILSLPHFMWANPIYKDSVIGCRADEAKHLTYVDLEPNTGTPMRGHKRVQYNMFVRPVKDVQVVQNMNTTLTPIFWVDEGVEINDLLYDQLDDLYLSKILLINVLTWTLMGLGIVAVLVTVVLIATKMCRKKQTST